MEIIRKIYKPTAIFLSFYMLMLACPYQSVLAAMIDTESIIDLDRDQEARDQLKQFLAREDVLAALTAHGIDPMDAKARIDALSDDEVIRIADQIDQLPAGGGAIGVLLLVILALFIVLAILDLTGVTDVFPF
jgi:hypothetical protein